MGGANDMEIRNETSDAMVLRFAIFQSEGGPVPNGVAITSATLSVYKYAGPDGQFKASRLLKSWNETQVTWNSRAQGAAWSSAGAQAAGTQGSNADYLASPDGQASIGADAVWLNIDVTSGVQAFAANPVNNFGWKVAQVSSSNPGGYKNFVSKDNLNFPDLRPRLTVTYSVAAACNSGLSRPYDQAPVSGNPISIPGAGATFEAEYFNCGGQNVAYHDNVAGNASGLYRTTEDVDITASPGASGYVVNNFETGEWLSYTLNVAVAGPYDLGIKASNNLGTNTAAFHIEIDGTNVGAVAVPVTGSWDTFGWFSKTGVWLNAGQHVLKLQADQQYANVDALRVLPASGGVSAECSAAGLALCIQFEATPDTAFAGTQVTSKSVGGSSIVWDAQNAAADSAIDTNRIALASGGRDGSSALRLQTLGNDANVHSSGDWERSEIQMSVADSATTPGTDSWWAHSLFVPADAALPSATDTQVNLFQFHGNIGSAPNFALSMINQTGNSPHKVFRAYSAGGATNSNDGMGTQYNYAIDGQNRIGQCIFDDFQQGVWYDFVHHIRWASDGTGRHEIWMRKAGGAVVKVLDRAGINTVYTGDSPYLKVGVYHSPVAGNTSAIHDRIRRGNSADAVRMADFTVDTGASVTWCAGVAH
jgi:hypothetical protein